jgi:hypothetical protein
VPLIGFFHASSEAVMTTTATGVHLADRVSDALEAVKEAEKVAERSEERQ